MDTRDPMERLSAAYRVEVDEESKIRHLAEMSAALKTAPPMSFPTGRARRRRVASALAAVFVVAAPVGMAVAAEDSVPGDFLYPMKQATERVRAVFDDEVEATHRVEEVERLVFLRAPRAAITRAVERAESATSDLVDRGTLGSRLESARRRLQELDEEERREREATESRSREQDETDRQGEGDRQGNDPESGIPEESDNGPGNSGAGSQQTGEGGGSGEGTGDQSVGGSAPGQSSQPDAEAGAGVLPGESSRSSETERVGTPDDPDVGSGNARLSSTTVP